MPKLYSKLSGLQQHVSQVISKPVQPLQEGTNKQLYASWVVSNCHSQNQAVSKVIELANKENIFDIKDLHSCTININFNSK